MRAVVLREHCGPEKLKFEDNVPEPQISGNTVLIGMAAASVNPIDWKLRSGSFRDQLIAAPLCFWQLGLNPLAETVCNVHTCHFDPSRFLRQGIVETQPWEVVLRPGIRAL